MADRLPFEYGPGCSGPVVSIGSIPYLPICSFPSFTQPTLALHHIDMTIPDLAPPPLCPCIWSVAAAPFSVVFTAISAAQASASLYFLPGGGNANCCEPSFNMSGNLKLPCMPFLVSHYASINRGKLSILFSKCPSCKLALEIKISVPCVPFATESIFSINPAKPLASAKLTGALVAATASCKLKFNIKLSLPFTSVTVVQSVSFVSGNLKYHTRILKVFGTTDGSDVTWATAEPCPP